MVQGDQCKSAKTPEHKCVRDARQGPLADHFPLQHHLPNELPHARSQRVQMEIGVIPGAADGVHRFAETHPEKRCRRAQQNEEKRNFRPGRVGHAVTLNVARGPGRRRDLDPAE